MSTTFPLHTDYFLTLQSSYTDDMRIAESYIQGKFDDAARCEDGLTVTPHFAAVVDGSTSKRAAKYQAGAAEGTSGGRRAMETVVAALQTLNAEATMVEAARHLTAALRDATPEAARTQAELRLTCSAAVFSLARREVWLFGDCQCRFGGRTYTNPKAVDVVLTRARCEAVRYLLAHGHTAEDIRRHDVGRAMIYDALREQTNFQNDPDVRNPFRYTVLDGFDIDTTTVPVLEVGTATRLILASDGYPVLCDALSETEAELARLLREDPLCIGENAATKCLMAGQVSFDDRAYLALEI